MSSANGRANRNTRKDAVMQSKRTEQRDVDRDRPQRAVTWGLGGDFAERNGVREEEIGERAGKQQRAAPREGAVGDVLGIHRPVL